MTDPSNLFKKIADNRRSQSEARPEPPVSQSVPPTELNKRGRPATGKRSDPNWLGRTYYIRKKTDLDIEGELYELKRQGIELDKSELVDGLLAAWLKWRQGENIDIHLSDISPRQKDENK
ncbi:MAG: hypothetical protein VKJ02_14450 [Snowella sp.]|nr:hypothetical protein [Snowella sp.]